MILELNNVVKKFETPDRNGLITILKNISLDVTESETVAIVGPSGSGKSTLLNIIGALDKPTSGIVKLAGREFSGLNEKDLALIRNCEIGFVFQLHHLLPQCSVLENVLIPTIPLRKHHKTENKEKLAMELLNRVGLENHLYHRPAQLSGGEQQRVAVVRALINQPKILLADEPTGSLDQKSSENLAELLCEINREHGLTLILVTHSIEIAKKMNRIYLLKEGYLKVYSEQKE
jgi:lipoprotein-releasing system ATP-binding protein